MAAAAPTATAVPVTVFTAVENIRRFIDIDIVIIDIGSCCGVGALWWLCVRLSVVAAAVGVFRQRPTHAMAMNSLSFYSFKFFLLKIVYLCKLYLDVNLYFLGHLLKFVIVIVIDVINFEGFIY